MDEQRFDRLSRRFAGFRTRRQAIKAIAGAAIGLAAGSRTAGATTACSTPYASCQRDDQCCAGAVCEYGLCMPGCRIEGTFYSPWSMPPGDICQVCAPEISTTSWSAANEGMSCWSGDPNAGVTTCQNGTCAGQTVRRCPPPTPCHLEGEVDPATGMCVNPPAPEGTLCGLDAICYGGFYQPADMCDGNGFCIGGGARTVNCAPYPCGDGACATTCSGDGDCSNGTVCCGGECVTLDTIDHCGSCGVSCAQPDACTPAECDNGSCNQTSICTPVDACTPAECDSGSCNEISACTGFDTCGGGGVAGQCGCTPSNPICQTACSEANGCGGVCAGRPATTPAISITFAPTGDPNFCGPTAHLSGFAGCTTYAVEYWSARSADGTVNPQRNAIFNVTTDPSGTSHTPTGSFFNQNRWIEFRIGAVRSGWRQVTCPPA